MDYEALAQLLFPEVTMTPEEVEAKFPPRDLPQGAKVTRFAPSPTGFVHFGGMYQAIVDERLAHQSGGVSVHFLLAVGQGVEITVGALAFAEGDVQIQTQCLLHDVSCPPSARAGSW